MGLLNMIQSGNESCLLYSRRQLFNWCLFTAV